MFVFQDWQYNKHDLRIRIVLVLFQLSQFLWQRGALVKIMSTPYFVVYRVLVVWIFHIELLPSSKIGQRLRLFHGYALVIHPSTVIGDDVTLRHSTTLGNKNSGGLGPQIGDRVNIGCNSVIIGNICIPSGVSVAGNPVRILHTNKNIGIN